MDRKKVDAWNYDLLYVMFAHLSKIALLGDKDKSKCDSLFYNFMDLLRKEVAKGNLSPDIYASAYDIAYFSRYNKSYYGRQLTFDPETGLNFCAPVEDVDNVDARRAEIGLPPVWAFCKKNNIKHPNNYIINK